MVTERRCDSCGEPNPADSTFCAFCGTYLGWHEPGRGPAAAPTTPPYSAPPPSDPRPSAGPAPVTPVQPAPASRQPTPQPASTQPIPAVPSAATAGAPCPHCGQPNEPSRRFCSRCGYVLTAPDAPQPRPAPATRTGSGWRFWRPSPERLARREYRRSLPPFYRWRRVILAVAAIAGVGVLVSVLDQDPVGRVRGLWYEFRDTTTPVADVEAGVSDGRGQRPVPDTAVVDRDPSTVWSRSWVAGTTYVGCSDAERDGFVVLRLPEPARVRELEIHAGLAAGVNERDLQFRPETVDVSWQEAGKETRDCVPVTLDDTADPQRPDLDTKVEVDRLRVSVSAVFEPKSERLQSPVSIRKLVVRVRPD